MDRAVAVSSVVLVLLSVAPAWSIIPVIDEANVVQTTTTALESISIAYNTAKSVINEYNIIRREIDMIANQVRNLQRIPDSLNFLDDITVIGGRMTGLLDSVNGVSFDLAIASRQFEQLYLQSQSLLDGSAIRAQRQRMLDGRLQAAQLSVRMGAIKQNVTTAFARLGKLLTGSYAAQGNLDSQQLKAQVDTIEGYTQQWMQAQMAANDRLQAQWQAEAATLEKLQLGFVDTVTATPPENGTYEPQGKLPDYRWTDR